MFPMKKLIVGVFLVYFVGAASAEEITEIDKNIIEAYLQPKNHLSFIELYVLMTGKKFADVKDHIKYLQDISAVKFVWDQDVKENSEMNYRIVEAFLKPKNKLFLVDLYVKMTGYSYDEALIKCKLIADQNDEVKAKWNRQYEERQKTIGLKLGKRKECDEYSRRARFLHSTIDYKLHNKCVAYNDSSKFDDYSERKDYKQTITLCLKSEPEFNDLFNEYEGLLEKQQSCMSEVMTMR